MKTIRLHPSDSVAVVIAPASSHPAVPVGHKVAVTDVAAGATVIKFGQPIGVATRDIRSGDHVHVHNCAYTDALAGRPVQRAPAILAMPARRSFLGFRRPRGAVGTRNFIGILSTVNCSATVCVAIAKEANRRFLDDHPGLDGVVPIVHDLGCGMSGAGSESFETLKRTLAGYQSHPNFAATVIVGLGCEVNQVGAYARDTHPLTRILTIQDSGGTRAAVEAGLAACAALAATVSTANREPCDVRHLTLGMQCGASDGFSALTANPALGVASDLLVAAGGTSFLSETPEIFGAETLLLSRADAATADKLTARLAWWRAYASAHGASLDNNPSPGNKAGGISTILEKSLGAVAKAGQAPLSDVVTYAERPTRPGLVFMDTPGYDPVSATGQIAGGATILAFTTGRGSCFGSKPAPTVKLASHSQLYDAMADDMDVDCGKVLDGRASLEELGQEIYDTILDVASGERSKSEINGLGDLEFAPWRLGAVL